MNNRYFNKKYYTEPSNIIMAFGLLWLSLLLLVTYNHRALFADTALYFFEILSKGSFRHHQYFRPIELISQGFTVGLFKIWGNNISMSFALRSLEGSYFLFPALSLCYCLYRLLRKPTLKSQLVCIGSLISQSIIFAYLGSYITFALSFFWPLILINPKTTTKKSIYMLGIIALAISYEGSFILIGLLALKAYCEYRVRKSKFLFFLILFEVAIISFLLYSILGLSNLSHEVNHSFYYLSHLPLFLIGIGVIIILSPITQFYFSKERDPLKQVLILLPLLFSWWFFFEKSIYRLVLYHYDYLLEDVFFLKTFPKSFFLFELFAVVSVLLLIKPKRINIINNLSLLILFIASLYLITEIDTVNGLWNYYRAKTWAILICIPLSLPIIFPTIQKRFFEQKTINNFIFPSLLISLLSLVYCEFYFNRGWAQYLTQLEAVTKKETCLSVSNQKSQRWEQFGASHNLHQHLSILMQKKWTIKGVVFGYNNLKKSPCNDSNFLGYQIIEAQPGDAGSDVSWARIDIKAKSNFDYSLLK